MRLGIDLGGTKIEIVALDEAGYEVHRERVPTPADDYAATLAAIIGLVQRAEARLGMRGTLGLGTPGSISRLTGLMRNSNSVCLNDHALKEDLEAALARDVRLANDANCFTLSEAVDGAAAGADTVFGVILGTGVGGGLVVHGRVLDGANGIAGEWGHNPLPRLDEEPHPLPRCYCGRAGCIEAYLSGPSFAREYAAHHPALKPAEIVARAAAGDADCEAELARYEARLARACAHVINIFDPHVIVLGGGMSNVDRLYDNVPSLWGPHIFSDRVVTRLVRNRHGDSSGVRGAAWLWNGA